MHTARRHDSAGKHVTGQATYTDDVPEPRDMLHVYIAMSASARARIGPVDLSPVTGDATVSTSEPSSRGDGRHRWDWPPG